MDLSKVFGYFLNLERGLVKHTCVFFFTAEDLHMLRSGSNSLCVIRLSGSCYLYPHYILITMQTCSGQVQMSDCRSGNVMLCVNTSHHTHSQTLNVKIKLLGQQSSRTVFTTEHPEAEFFWFRLPNIHKVWSEVTWKGTLESILLHRQSLQPNISVLFHLFNSYRQENSFRCALIYTVLS